MAPRSDSGRCRICVSELAITLLKPATPVSIALHLASAASTSPSPRNSRTSLTSLERRAQAWPIAITPRRRQTRMAARNEQLLVQQNKDESCATAVATAAHAVRSSAVRQCCVGADQRLHDARQRRR